MILNPMTNLGGGLPTIKPLNEYTWDEISVIAKSGVANEYFKSGDTKTISFVNKNYPVQIIGFGHDDVSDALAYGKAKAGITFQFGSGSSSIYGNGPMHEINNNGYGWNQCKMRTSTLNGLYGYLPEDLQKVIVNVVKRTNGTESTVDNLWLLSEIEIYGSRSVSQEGEGNQYEFYKNGGSIVRYLSGAASPWWIRSAYYGDMIGYCYVDKSGKPGHTGATVSQGISFGFCL